MNDTQQFTQQTKALIDDLKSVCANCGLGNDGNEFKIITQVFLYKFLNDKFVHEIKQLDVLWPNKPPQSPLKMGALGEPSSFA